MAKKASPKKNIAKKAAKKIPKAIGTKKVTAKKAAPVKAAKNQRQKKL